MKKRTLPPHIVLPDGRWRFVKKNKIRREKPMARGRRYYRAKRVIHRARSFGGGGKYGNITKNVIDGVIVGVANAALPEVIPMQDGLVTLGVGWFRRNPTLTTLGGIQVGAQLGAMIGGTIGGGLKTGGQSQV